MNLDQTEATGKAMTQKSPDYFALVRATRAGMVCLFVDSYIDDYINLEGNDECSDAFLESVETFGIVELRVPTADEFADPKWFGHAQGYAADCLCVYEKTPLFLEMVEAERKEAERRGGRTGEDAGKDSA